MFFLQCNALRRRTVFSSGFSEFCIAVIKPSLNYAKNLRDEIGIADGKS